MKFLLIANNDTDGIGQPVVNLFNNLIKKGHKAKIIALHKFTKNKNIIKIKRSFLSRLYALLLDFLKKDFNDLFGFDHSTIEYKDIENYIEETDVIIIYTFHKMISNNILEKLFKSGKLVYLRPLDMEMITGGCHFNQKCEKYRSDCSNCPKLRFNELITLPKENLITKRTIVRNFKPKIIVQNNYVKNLLKTSSIFNFSKTIKISVGVNASRSKFYLKKKARKILGIDIDEKIILFAIYNLSSYNKGGHVLKKSLKIFEDKFLNNKNYNKDLSNVRLITLGNKNNFSLDLEKIKWSHKGFVSSDAQLNLYYRSADVLVSPSLYDFGPHVVNESVSNDLPVVSFEVGTARDVIVSGVNGFLVPCYDNSKFANSIQKIIFNKKDLKNNSLRKRIKSSRSAAYEAKSFIKMSYKDIKNKKN